MANHTLSFTCVAGDFYRYTPGSLDLSYDLGAGDVAVTPATPVIFRATGTTILFTRTVDGASLPFEGDAPIGSTLEHIAATDWQSSAGAYVSIIASDAADNQAAVRCIWRDSTGKRYVSNGVSGLQLVPPPADGFVEIEAVFKPATAGDFSINVVDPVFGTFTAATLAAADTRSPAYQRLRLFGIPSLAASLKVLGKAKYVPLDFDEQEQTVRNSENCLIAFARGDLLRHGGENGAAQLAYQEAASLLQALKDLEAVQAANNQRIIPDAGFGDDYGFGPQHQPYF